MPGPAGAGPASLPEPSVAQDVESAQFDPAPSPPEPSPVEHEEQSARADGPNERSEVLPAEPAPAESPASGAQTAVQPPVRVAPVVQGDWLASVCPYLASEDGTYRSATPDQGHRCVAVDPAATLPLAFQERFCLTERHPRCEMYKFAQETGHEGGLPIPAAALTAATTRPVRDSSGSRPNRAALIAAAGIGGVVVLALLLVLVMGSCSGGGDAPADPSSAPQATEVPGATPAPTPTPAPERTPQAESTSTPGAAASEEPVVAGTIILYEIQEGEALLKISQSFGVSRNRLRRDNPELVDIAPADMAGMVIEIPLSSEMSIEEVEAMPGFQGFVP
jgi:hypothetical protein